METLLCISVFFSNIINSALKNGYRECSIKLVKSGADFSVPNRSGYTAISLASKYLRVFC